MKHGTVKEYDRTKGFGFVSGDDYILHVSGLRQHVQQRGLRVVFDVDFGMSGDKAINVRPE